MKRTNNADLKYPIILTDKGVICDGWHRLCKAVYQGDEYIKAIRIEKMPEYSGKEIRGGN